MSTHSNNTFFVLSCLTGTDRNQILSEAQNLQGPVPPKGSADYQTLLSNFQNSPANVLATLAQFLQTRANWAIDSDTNFQNYLNSFNNAPFLAGTLSGPIQGSDNTHTIPDLIGSCLSSAGIPASNQADVAAQLGLTDLFAGDFENAPITLSFIVQNIQSSDGNLSLIWKKTTLTVAYHPPERSGIIKNKPKTLPTYNLTETGTVITVQAQTANYFKANSEQFLGLGLTNIADWMKNNTTPATA